jgi:hypothetical protein
MRAEILVEVVGDILKDLEEQPVLHGLQRLNAAVQRLSENASAENQKAVDTWRETVAKALSKTRFKNYPALKLKVLKEIRADQFVGQRLAEDIDRIFAGQGLTPAIAAQRLGELTQLIKDLRNESVKLLSGAEYFDVGSDRLDPGTFEIIIAIPRGAVQDELEEFGKETLKLNRILGVFSEIATGTRDKIKMRAVASSDPTYFLVGAPAVAMIVATAVERIAAFYERILTIVKMRRDLKSQEVPNDIVSALKDHIDASMRKGIEDVAADIQKQYFRGVEKTRKQELETELLNALSEIAERLDNGYLFDVRGEPLADTTDDEAAASESEKTITKVLRKIDELRPRLQQFEAESEPILRLLTRDEDSEA